MNYIQLNVHLVLQNLKVMFKSGHDREIIFCIMWMKRWTLFILETQKLFCCCSPLQAEGGEALSLHAVPLSALPLSCLTSGQRSSMSLVPLWLAHREYYSFWSQCVTPVLLDRMDYLNNIWTFWLSTITPQAWEYWTNSPYIRIQEFKCYVRIIALICY